VGEPEYFVSDGAGGDFKLPGFGPIRAAGAGYVFNFFPIDPPLRIIVKVEGLPGKGFSAGRASEPFDEAMSLGGVSSC